MPARIPEEVRIKQVNAIPNIEFLRWADGYKNSKSKANVRCKVDGFVWSAMVSNIIYHCSGCPHCANQRRWTAKERVDQINCLKGVKFIGWIDGYDGVKIAELEKYFHGKYERAGFNGFDGATEWLVCSDDLLKEISEMGR